MLSAELQAVRGLCSAEGGDGIRRINRLRKGRLMTPAGCGSFLLPCRQRKGHKLRRYLLIALGGALGALARYGVGEIAAEHYGTRFPVGTLTINISACFIIGFVIEYLNRHIGLSDGWRYLIPIGFIGAYSTFSTFEFETWSAISRGAYWTGAIYLGSSLVGGFIAVGLGVAAGRAV